MNTFKPIVAGFMVAGMAIMLSTVTGCDEGGSQNNLLTNPDAANHSGKAPRIYVDPTPVPSDTALVTDSTHYEAVCVEDPDAPAGGAAAAAAGTPCAAITIHLKWPLWRISEKITGRHIKFGVDASNYYFKDTGEYWRHVKSGIFASTYETYDPL